MSNREKIIVFLMCAAVAYGVYALFISPDSGSDLPVVENRVEEYKALAATINENMKQEMPRLSKAVYVAGLAESAWSADPFLSSATPVQFGQKDKKPAGPVVSPAELGFSFTGFLQAGSKFLAVINGREYETGDHLVTDQGPDAAGAGKAAAGAYMVKSISPRQVVIVSDLEQTEIVLPLEDIY